MIAVRSHAVAFDAVGVCTGEPLKALVRRLDQEHFTIVRWDESPAVFLHHALANAALKRPEIKLDPAARRADVTVDRAAFTELSRAEGLQVRLASRLTGWEIRLQVGDS